MKKYMPKTGTIALIIFIMIISIVFYGEQIPNDFLFREFFSKMGKIGSSLLILLYTGLCVAGVFLVVGVLLKYEEWRNTEN